MEEKNNKTNRVKLNKRFYDQEAVKRTAEIFKELAEIRITEDDKHHIVDIVVGEKDVGSETSKEFCNYALAFTKENES